MRLISANLQYGTPGKGVEPRGDLWQCLAEQFVSYRPDAICLQEVDFYQFRSGFTDQTRALSLALTKASGKTWRYRFLSFFAGQTVLGIRLPVSLPIGSEASQLNPLRADRPLFGGFGVGVLTPHPVRRWVSAKLGAAAPRINITGWDPRSWRFYGGQTRNLVGAEISTPDGRFLVSSTHLELGVSVAKRQLVRSWQGLCSLAGQATPVLTGDLNLRKDVVAEIFPYLTTADVPTYPVADPTFQIDHVLAPPNCRVLDAGNIQMPVSDHRALFVNLKS